ncbi:hypothetical protein AVEN_99755-1 [Araneus ventricosus]|uniref:Uncharacterized protein n=1 Tax=Araneus ventricosus TaxID=182803 RepID=A0A4Y2DJC0_ARAVE|nr:hypothetical protein AVEN_99755-1 [Araneus ventricosus]
MCVQVLNFGSLPLPSGTHHGTAALGNDPDSNFSFNKVVTVLPCKSASLHKFDTARPKVHYKFETSLRTAEVTTRRTCRKLVTSSSLQTSRKEDYAYEPWIRTAESSVTNLSP